MEIDQPWIDLRQISNRQISRNRLAAALLNHLGRHLEQYQQYGMQPFIEQWQALDSYLGQAVDLVSPASVIKGKVCGIDEHGSLLLETAEGVQAYQSGEVSLRGG